MDKFSLIYSKQGLKFDLNVLEAMMSYNWPGNVRELMNVIERCVILTESKLINKDLLPHRIFENKNILNPNMTLAQVEKAHIQQVLQHAHSQQEAAKILGIDPATLWRKKKEYGIY